MTCNFDLITSRTNTNCLKYDFADFYGKPSTALPMWIADMDFPTPPMVQEKLVAVARHGIFG
jgi:cystathionine beta-lyase